MKTENLNITLEVSNYNEGTSYPWWMIVDPKQNFHTNEDGVHNVAGMITGPFFSREKAEEHLQARRYAFGKGAHVYCASGYWSEEYTEACGNAKRKENKNEKF